MRLLILITLCAAACDGRSDDSMYVTGTEEAALTDSEGAPSCRIGKVLLCHIPPGNPANEHTLCVGAAAVQAHQRNHTDLLGACDTSGGGDPGQPAGGVEPATPVIVDGQ